MKSGRILSPIKTVKNFGYGEKKRKFFGHSQKRGILQIRGRFLALSFLFLSFFPKWIFFKLTKPGKKYFFLYLFVKFYYFFKLSINSFNPVMAEISLSPKYVLDIFFPFFFGRVWQWVSTFIIKSVNTQISRCLICLFNYRQEDHNIQ